jgi:hypothetical protein
MNLSLMALLERSAGGRKPEWPDDGDRRGRTVARAVERLAMPPADLVSKDGAARDDPATDGTGRELRLEALGWQVVRTSNHYARGLDHVDRNAGAAASPGSSRRRALTRAGASTSRLLEENYREQIGIFLVVPHMFSRRSL